MRLGHFSSQLVKLFFVIFFYLIPAIGKTKTKTKEKQDRETFSLVAGPDQRRLLKYLLTEKQYDPLERPVANDSHTLPVTMNLALQQIIDYVCSLIRSHRQVISVIMIEYFLSVAGWQK